MNKKLAATVTVATMALLPSFKEGVLTITRNNAREYAYHEQVKKLAKFTVYFSEPLLPWTRSLNENSKNSKLTGFKKYPNYRCRNNSEDLVINLITKHQPN